MRFAPQTPQNWAPSMYYVPQYTQNLYCYFGAYVGGGIEAIGYCWIIYGCCTGMY